MGSKIMALVLIILVLFKFENYSHLVIHCLNLKSIFCQLGAVGIEDDDYKSQHSREVRHMRNTNA